MQKLPIPFKKYIFVCINRRDEGACCGPAGGQEIRERFKQLVKEKGLQGIIRVSQSGCMDVCAKGPNVMVFPDEVWYQSVALEDVAKIFNEIILGLPSLRQNSR